MTPFIYVIVMSVDAGAKRALANVENFLLPRFVQHPLKTEKLILFQTINLTSFFVGIPMFSKDLTTIGHHSNENYFYNKRICEPLSASPITA